MKKIIIALLFMCNFAQANDLSTSICESNLTDVIAFLKQHSLTEKEKLKFIDIANKMIDLRRDQMACAQMNRYGPQPEIAISLALGLSSGSISIASMIFACLAFVCEKKRPNELLAPYRYPLLALAAISFVPAIFWLRKTRKKSKELIESFPKNYNNAIKIKEALLNLLEN